jgi:DNA-binding NarL/FixJ family response regulator
MVRKTRIVIADDHAVVRAALRRMLASYADLDVVGEAENSWAAIQTARAVRPDVVLLDIAMPGCTWIQAIDRIREEAPDARILIVTGHDDPVYLRSALAAGCAGYFVKTGSEDELLRAVRAVSAGRIYVDVSLAGSAADEVAFGSARPAGDGGGELSPREQSVLRLVAYGYTHKEIAKKLYLSVKTVDTYRARLAEKVGLRRRADVVRFALDAGLLRPGAGEDDA